MQHKTMGAADVWTTKGFAIVNLLFPTENQRVTYKWKSSRLLWEILGVQ